MEEQFTKREVVESGDLLHIFALKLMMSHFEVSEATVDRTVAECKSYIDDLLGSGRLPPRTNGYRWFDSFETGYRTTSYWVEPDYAANFNELLAYLIRAREDALGQTYASRIPELLDVVRRDGMKFFERVCFTRDNKPDYEDIPILAHIPPVEFVDAWFASPKSGWYWIAKALNERSKAVAHYPSLRPEANWYPEVVRLMSEKRDQAKRLSKVRLQRTIEAVGVAPAAAPVSPVGPKSSRAVSSPRPATRRPRKATPNKRLKTPSK